MKVWRKTLTFAICGALYVLAGCAGLRENDRLLVRFAEHALGGANRLEAEVYLDAALSLNPDNPYALLDRALVYSASGQRELARGLYGRVLALDPTGKARIATPGGASPPLVKVAQDALARGDRARPPRDAHTAPRRPGVVRGAILARFRSLDRLRKEGHITEEEYEVRRAANLPALLPLTASPTVLPQPMKLMVRQLAGLRRSLDEGEIGAREYAALRALALDRLMPRFPLYLPRDTEAVDARASLANLTRRSKRVRTLNLVSEDEYARERSAIAAASAAREPAPRIAAASPGTETPRAAGAATAGGSEPATERASRPDAASLPVDVPKPRPPDAGREAGRGSKTMETAETARDAGSTTTARAAVQLAAYRSHQGAERGWAQISGMHPDLLSTLEHRIAWVDLGPPKNVFYRLLTGPFHDRSGADALCRQLQSRRLDCIVRDAW